MSTSPADNLYELQCINSYACGYATCAPVPHDECPRCGHKVFITHYPARWRPSITEEKIQEEVVDGMREIEKFLIDH